MQCCKLVIACLASAPACGMLTEMRDAVIWGGAVLIGIAVERIVPDAPVAALVLAIATPVVVLLVVRRLPAAMFALSGVVVGVFGDWWKGLLETEARCNAPLVPGRVVCSRFGEAIPSLTATIALVAIGLAIAVAAIWMTRARQRVSTPADKDS